MKKGTPQGDVVETMTLEELCRFCRADTAWVIELVDEGVIQPRGASVPQWRFGTRGIARAKRARRLARDLELSTAAVAMVLDLLDERDAILRRLSRYETI